MKKPSPFDKPVHAPPPIKITLTLQRGEGHSPIALSVTSPPWSSATEDDKLRVISKLEEGLGVLMLKAGLHAEATGLTKSADT